MRIDHCRSCGSPIIWTVTSKGKRMPVDAEPGPDGLLTLDTLASGVVVASHASAEQPGLFARERYTSHFATCPEAKEWRHEKA